MQFKSFFKRLKPKNKKGFLGLDTMGSLIVIMILTGGIIAGISQLTDSSKVSNMRNGLNSLNMGIRQLFVGGSDYSALGTDGTTAAGMLFNADIVPETLFSSKTSSGDNPVTTNKILTPWGGDITVKAVGTAQFSITLAGVPTDACIKIASGNQSAWDSVSAGGTPVTSLTTANSACSATDTVDMVFTAR